jgi:hypothetical protein
LLGSAHCIGFTQSSDIASRKIPGSQPGKGLTVISEVTDGYNEAKPKPKPPAFVAKEEKLVLNFPHAEEGFVLDPKGKDVFKSYDLGLELTFLRNKHGKVKGLGVVTGRANKVLFKKLKRGRDVK